jgi:hypothetical protein
MPLEAQLRGVLEHRLPVPGQVLGVDDGKPDVVLPEEIGKHLLALHLGQFPEIAVAPEKIESVVDETILFARSEFGLEF